MPTQEKNFFDDDLPGMEPVEGANIQENDMPDFTPTAPAQGVAAEGGQFLSWKDRMKNLSEQEPMPWADVRQISSAEADAALISRGLLTAKEVENLNRVSDALKNVVNLDQLKVNTLAGADSRAGDLYNLCQLSNFKRSNPILVRVSVGEGLPKLTMPVQFEPFEKKDGTIGMDVISLEARRPTLYVVNGFGDKLFPPLPFRKDMTDDEKAALRDARDFDQAYFEKNGCMPRPVKVRTWNEITKKIEIQMCLVGRKGGDYRLVTVPMDTIEARLKDRPNRSVYAGGVKYNIDLSKEKPEVLHNLVHAGGAWVKATPAEGGEKKDMFIVYDVASRNVKAGYSTNAVRQEVREAFKERQEAKKARENKASVQQKPADADAPKHSLR